MRAFAIVRLVVAAAIIAGAVALARIGGLHGDPHQVLKAVFDHASGLPRQAMVALIIAAPLAILLTLARFIRRKRHAPAQSLSLFNALAPLVGMVAAAADMIGVAGVVPAGHWPRLGAIAPALAEAALVLGLGLLVGAIAALPKGASWNGGT